MALVERLYHKVEQLYEKSDSRKFWLLALFSVIYFTSTFSIASRRLMWNDELLTFYTSLRPTLADIWSALLSGSQQVPPPFFWITRASIWLFGKNELSVRLPEMLGVWMMSLCIFQFVQRRSSIVYGLAAMLFPLTTPAFYYACEARSYGLVLGFSALSLLCWQSAIEKRYRKISIVGLALSGIAAVSVHYYAILFLSPLILGESVRYFSWKRFDGSIWIAFLCALLPLFLFMPLIQHSASYSTSFWSKPQWSSIILFYVYLLRPALVPILGTLLIAVISSRISAGKTGGSNMGSPSGLARAEFIAILGFVVIPIVQIVLAKFVTGAYTDRYALPSVIGFSVLVSLSAYRFLDTRKIVGMVMVLFFLCALLARSGRDFVVALQDRSQLAETIQFLQGQDSVIAVGDPYLFLQLSHYGPSSLTKALLYLADEKKALRYVGTPMVDEGVLELRDCAPIQVRDYSSYLSTQSEFLVYWNGEIWSWALAALLEDNAHIELLEERNSDLLMKVGRAPGS